MSPGATGSSSLRFSALRFGVFRALVRRDYSLSRSYRFALVLDAFFGGLNLLVYYFISATFESASTAELAGAPSYFAFAVVGVTLSRFQVEWAQAKILATGLQDRIKIELTDYRDLKEAESFDKIATIEVAEHFGAEQFPTYMRQCERLLRPGGALLMQQITLTGKNKMPPADREFCQHFVFPDGELVPVSFTLGHAESAGLEVRDVECFREHYIHTLGRWLANLEGRREGCVADTDEATYRIFRLYLSGALSGFERNLFNLHQMLFVKPNQQQSGMPLSRGDWYG